MYAMRRTIAAAELMLLFPSALFMTALFVRNLSPKQLEPARTAQAIVMWYAGRVHLGLWLFLIAMPLAVFVIGGLTLLHSWSDDAELRAAAMQTLAAIRVHFAIALIAAATVASGFFVAAIAVHVLTD